MNVSWVTLFWNCWQNIDLSINTALVNGGYFHHTDMKKFLQILFLWNHWSDVEIISQECSLDDTFLKLLAKFWSVNKHGSGEWGYFHYTGMKKFLQILFLWNHQSDFEIISQECSLGDPLLKLLAKFWSIDKHGSGEWKLHLLYGHEEIIRIFSETTG